MPQTFKSSTPLTSYTFKIPKSTKIKPLGFKICINSGTSSQIKPPKSNLRNQTNTNEKGRIDFYLEVGHIDQEHQQHAYQWEEGREIDVTMRFKFQV